MIRAFGPRTDEEIGFYESIIGKARKKPRECHCSGCAEPTIKGHVLARSHLKHIVEDGHFYIFSEQSSRRVYESGQPYFDKIGVKKVAETGHGMQGFCGFHDADLFEPIEGRGGNIDLDDYKSLLLLCYRSLVHEITKRENSLEVEKVIKSSKKFSYLYKLHQKNYFNTKHFFLPSMNEEMLRLEQAIRNGRDRPLSFVVEEIEDVGFFMCGYTGTCFIDILNMKAIKDKKLYISVIPQEKSTKIVIGYSDPMDLIAFANKEKIFDKKLHLNIKFVSDLALRNLETWGCSEAFYNRHISPREGAIIDEHCRWRRINKFSPEPVRLSLFDLPCLSLLENSRILYP